MCWRQRFTESNAVLQDESRAQPMGWREWITESKAVLRVPEKMHPARCCRCLRKCIQKMHPAASPKIVDPMHFSPPPHCLPKDHARAQPMGWREWITESKAVCLRKCIQRSAASA